jgi:dihydrolipoamide dehydrogenase
VPELGLHSEQRTSRRRSAIQLGATVSQVADMIHAHPTLAEGFMEAAEAAEDKAIHHVKKQVG